MGIESDHSETYSLDELLARARAGEGQAFCELAAQHEARLFQQACGLISFGLNHVDDKGRIGSVREDPWPGPIPFVQLNEGDWVWGSPQAGKGQSEARSSQ